MPRYSRTLLLCAFVLVTGSPVVAQKSATIPGLDQIVQARVKVSYAVRDIKAKYQPTDPQYVNARKLYIEAQAGYAGWVSQVRAAVVIGTAKNLIKDEEYQKIAKAAQAASKAFIDYAEQSTVTSKGVGGVLTALADLGIKIWNGLKSRQAAERKEAADFIGSETKWPNWEEIQGKPSARLLERSHAEDRQRTS
jgi:hypothetical protein